MVASTTPPTGGYAPDGALASSAQIYGPFDVFVDGSDNVFIADLGNNFDGNGNPDVQAGQPPNNNVVREVLNADGTIHTVAGLVTLVGGVPTGQYTPVVASGPAAVGTALNEPKGCTSMARKATSTSAIRSTRSFVRFRAATSASSLGTLGHRRVLWRWRRRGQSARPSSFPAGTFVDSNGNILISDDGSNAVREVPSTSGGGADGQRHLHRRGQRPRVFAGGDAATATTGELNTPQQVSPSTPRATATRRG